MMQSRKRVALMILGTDESLRWFSTIEETAGGDSSGKV